MEERNVSITIKDVAADAGVSTATVSNVINKTRFVSHDVEARVNASISKLNYYPNQLVRSLRGKKTNTIGMVIPSISNETFGKLAEHIQTLLFDEGYNLIVCNTFYDPAVEERALNTFLLKKVDAVVAIPASRQCPKIKEIVGMHIPVVLVDRVLDDVQTDAVVIDNFTGQYESISYMIRMGHRHIGYVDRMVEQSHSIAQRKGYLAALADHDIEANARYIVKASGHYYRAGMEAAQTLMQRNPELTAIAGYYDLMAFGIMRGLIDLGYHVPEDVSVIGYDNMLFTEATWPSMTTVQTPLMQMAEKTCALIKQRLDEKTDGRQAEPLQYLELQPRLVIRESVRKIVRPKPRREEDGGQEDPNGKVQ